MKITIAGAFTHNLMPFLLKSSLYKKHDLTVYDGPNNCAWNGGRINRDITITEQDILSYNALKIKVALTFSNPEINLKDPVGNALLKNLESSQNKTGVQNEIILINSKFRKFLRKKYSFILKFSITGHDLLAYPPESIQEKYQKYYDKLEKKYDIVVPKMEHVFQEWFLQNRDLSKYEIMVNDTCRPDCPYYKSHFEEIAKMNLVFKNEKSAYDYNPELSKRVEECWLPNFNPDKELTSCGTGMDFDSSMIKKARKLGYSRFKISGRENKLSDILRDINAIL